MYWPTPELDRSQRAAGGLREGSDTRLLDLPSRHHLGSETDHTMLAMNGVLTSVAAVGADVTAARPEVVEPAHLPPQADPSDATALGGIMLVGSSGGHLAQLLALEPWWALKGRHWVTFRTPDAESLLHREQVTWAHYPTTRNIPNLLRNALLAVRTLRRHRPDAIVSTGAGVALPFFMVGRLLGIPTVYIEVFDRIDSRTLTARLCGPFTTTLLVQWEEQQLLYPHATVVGTLL